MVKSAARPKTTEDPGPVSNNIALVDLNNPSIRSHPNIKGNTIPGWMHGMGGYSGKTLTHLYILEVVVTSIMGAFNSTKKVGTLLGGRPDEDITCLEIVEIVRDYLVTHTVWRHPG